jgi:hypothetical protein
MDAIGLTNGQYKLRVLANDGSVHIFPAGTNSRVIGAALARYHASLAQSATDPVSPESASSDAMRAASSPGTDQQPTYIQGVLSSPARAWYVTRSSTRR